ncbi:MAG: GAF domain-containing protein [Methylacidiphilales bacterium]|nr:GAF domain-containing protein [Candidatus Methylacidiphilales bacterium]
MTNVYQENQGNGHHVAEAENSEMAVASNKDIFDLSTTEQQLKLCRQMFSGITIAMQQAKDTYSLTSIATQQIREKLECDRTLVYRFNSADSGVVVAESRANSWTPAKDEVLPAIVFGMETSQQYMEAVILQVSNQAEISPYQAQLLEKYQIKSSLSIPILFKDEIWGLVVVQSCSAMRQWQEIEINLLSQIAVELNYKFQSFEFQSHLQQQAQEQKAVAKVINRIRQSLDLDAIFKNTTKEVRQLIGCDRVSVYRFNSDWSGEYIGESVAPGWTPLVGKDIKTVWEDTHLQETQGGRYAKGESFAVNDIYQMGHSQCYLELLEQFEAKAYMTVPIFKGQELWGLLATYQNSGSRHWEESELTWLNQIALQFGVAISQAEYVQQVQQQSQKLTRTAERQQSLIDLTRKIGETLTEAVTDSSQFDKILQTTVIEVRQLLQADRSVVYRFNADWSGDFIAESVGKNWVPFRERNIDPALLQQNGHCDTFKNLASFHKNKDKHLQETQGGRYKQKTIFVVNDVEKAGFPLCYMELLRQFEAKAYLTVPIFKENKLWGLLATYQNSTVREWEEFEVTSMQQIAVLLGVAMQQAETVEKLQQQSQEIAKTAELDRAVANVVEKIRESLEMQDVFTSATKELRSLLKVDRSIIYRFNPDWSGEFVAESVGNGWIRLLNIVTADTNLRETQGGRYAKREYSAVPDIYTTGFDSCHLELLEQYQARAYIIVPIFQGQKLWGLLAVYQNSSTRQWQETDITLLTKISDQLGVALQQAEYLQQLQAQSLQVVEAGAREKEAKEYLQKGAMKLLSAVRPALDGDLTVRAPLSEDELGTIADAYNNTLQALRQIVIQVQAAAQQVAEKSNQSNASLSGLTTLAQQQSKEMDEALEEVQEMVDSTQAVVGNAEQVQAVVEEANHTVELGDGAMNRTVEAIQGIRETVAQTSKKIKRLSESSQKISKVVSLISNFATQTNVLALNAAIEATRAGEYGKGFAVVADEVRSLSRQSAAATIEIEKLVQEIQEETGEVSVAMETGIQQVVEGTALVNETRQSLNAIVTATAEISKLLQQITDATQGQMLQSVSVTASMKDVAKIATKTSTEASNIAIVFRELSETAQELLASASKFKVN